MVEVENKSYFTWICTGICFAGVIVALVFGILYAVQAKEEIGHPHHLWFWVVIYCGVLTASLLSTLTKMLFPTTIVSTTVNDDKVHTVIKYVFDYKNPLDIILRVADLGMFIWAIVIMAQEGIHGPHYDRHLWTWFCVMFWLLVAWALLVFITCVFACCLGCLAGFTRAAGVGRSEDTLPKV